MDLTHRFEGRKGSDKPAASVVAEPATDPTSRRDSLQMKSVLLISPSILEREALALILERAGFAVHTASYELEELDGAALRPDVILLDLPGDPAALNAAWLQELHSGFPNALLVVLAQQPDTDWLLLCRGAKLDGYLSKTTPAPIFCRQLGLIAGGERILPVRILREMASTADQSGGESDVRRRALCKRDLDVLRLLVAGHSNKVIAARLQIAESTVKVAMKTVFAKISVANRTQAAVWALNNGIDTPVGSGDAVRSAS